MFSGTLLLLRCVRSICKIDLSIDISKKSILFHMRRHGEPLLGGRESFVTVPSANLVPVSMLSGTLWVFTAKQSRLLTMPPDLTLVTFGSSHMRTVFWVQRIGEFISTDLARMDGLP